jgi:hypothetical protein
MEKAMYIRSGRRLALLVVGALALGPLAARAQFVTDVNSVIVEEYRLFCCNSDLTVTNNYPTSVVIDDQYSSTTGGIHHANRHDLDFSSNNGATARTFNTTDSFDLSFDIKLEAGANSPRKEAGLIIDQPIGGSQFIVNTDGTSGTGFQGEIVVFGGFQPFYSFNLQHGISYTAGETINMRMIYNGKTATAPGNFQYIVKKNNVTYSSPIIDSGAGEQGIANGSQLTLYAQGKAATVDDFERATFSNIVFGTGNAVPGDYNNNGTVDMGDYVLWRKGTGVLANEVADPGVFSAQDYTEWRARFGNPSGAGSGGGLSGGAVPEPASAWLLVMSALTFQFRVARMRRREI